MQVLFYRKMNVLLVIRGICVFKQCEIFQIFNEATAKRWDFKKFFHFIFVANDLTEDMIIVADENAGVRSYSIHGWLGGTRTQILIQFLT